MYRGAGYSAFTVDALLGAYVVGLVPGLLLSGGLSNRYGRKPVMLLGTAASLLASVMLALGGLGVGWLAAGRFVTGTAVAVAMAVGSTWVKELADLDPASAPDLGTRRAALWLTLGLGIGPGRPARWPSGVRGRWSCPTWCTSRWSAPRWPSCRSAPRPERPRGAPPHGTAPGAGRGPPARSAVRATPGSAG